MTRPGAISARELRLIERVAAALAEYAGRQLPETRDRSWATAILTTKGAPLAKYGARAFTQQQRIDVRSLVG
jgi:hypothetical protein